jgi:hypothetical protein
VVSDEQRGQDAAAQARQEVDRSNSYVSELLLKAQADEDEAEHVGDQVQNTGMQPDGGDEAIALVLVHDLVPHKCSHLL